MDTLFNFIGIYDTREDIPQREKVPGLKDDDRLLYLTTEIKLSKYNKSSRLSEYTGKSKYAAFSIDPDRIPTIEREYLADPADLFKLGRQFIRPLRQMTREECNTRAGRMALLSWPNGFPRATYGSTGLRCPKDMNDDLLFDVMQKEPAQIQDTNLSRERETFDPDAHPFYFWENNVLGESTNAMLYRPQPDDVLLRWYDCLFKPEKIGYTLDYTFTLPPVFREYLPDMAFAVDLNTEILNRDQFAAIVGEKADPRSVPVLMQKYDYCQKMVDRLFATYELFRTEKYESIAALPLNDQRAAIRNYFATFTYYGNRGAKVVEKVGGAELLTYNKTKYVVSNMAKYLGIPPEVLAYARKEIAVEPLFVDNKSKEPKPQPIGDESKTGFKSKELDKQRTQYGGQLELYFGDYIGRPVTEWGGVRLDSCALWSMVVADTANRKLFNELMYSLTTRADFDLMEYVERVANVQSKEDIVKLYGEMAFTVDYGEMVKMRFGKVSPENIKKMDEIFANLPDEPFVFYRMIKKTDKNGNEIFIHINSRNKNKYAKDQREITSVGQRFTLGNYIFENNGGRKTMSRIMYAHPAAISNMMDGNGRMTNYDKLTPEYMEYNRQIANTDRITPATEKILKREYDKRFPMAAAAARTAIHQAKNKGENRPNKLTLYNLKQGQFYSSIDKNALLIAVCTNAGIISERWEQSKESARKFINRNLKAMQRKRAQQNIEQALELLKTHNVIIDNYSSSDDGAAWLLHFVQPS